MSLCRASWRPLFQFNQFCDNTLQLILAATPWTKKKKFFSFDTWWRHGGYAEFSSLSRSGDRTDKGGDVMQV
jgi:hypothetical protein